MIFNFLVFTAFVSATNAGVQGTLIAPVFGKTVVHETYDAHPQYNYGYSVQDSLTGDSKTHYEQRDGDVVSGQYTVVDADGFRRVVDYTADPIHGFNAVVHREPLTLKTAPIAAPLTYAPVGHYSAPVVAKVAAPVSHTTYIHH